MLIQPAQAGPHCIQRETSDDANDIGPLCFQKFVVGTIRGQVIFRTAFAAGESLTINTLRGDTGASILTAPLVLDATDAPLVAQAIPFSQALFDAVPNETLVLVTFAYVAGGAPANPTVLAWLHVGAGFPGFVGGVMTTPNPLP